jgi:hypothetical protein
MSETRIPIRLLRMYFPRKWEFGSAMSKLWNFGRVWILKPPSVRHWVDWSNETVKRSICWLFVNTEKRMHGIMVNIFLIYFSFRFLFISASYLSFSFLCVYCSTFSSNSLTFLSLPYNFPALVTSPYLLLLLTKAGTADICLDMIP